MKNSTMEKYEEIENKFSFNYTPINLLVVSIEKISIFHKVSASRRNHNYRKYMVLKRSSNENIIDLLIARKIIIIP